MPKRSVRRMILCSLRSSTSARALTPVTPAATFTGQSRAHPTARSGVDGGRPATDGDQIFATVMPAPQTAPLPVMTMRGDSAHRSGFHEIGMAQHEAAVRAAEAERVGQRGADAHRARLAGHEVRVAALGIAASRPVCVHRHLAVAGSRARTPPPRPRRPRRSGGPSQLFVELTATFARCAAQHRADRAHSLRSFIIVDVPCALM